MTGFTDEQRRQLAGQARTLFERLSGPENDAGSTSVDVDEAFAQWESELGESLSERLERDGTTVAECRAAATATEWPDDRPLPDWVDRIDSLAAFLEEERPETTDDEPFGAFHAGVTAFARRRLSAATLDGITDAAIDGAAEWLQRRVARLSTRILYVEFKTAVARDDEELAFADPGEFDDPPTERYEQFVAGLFGPSFRRLCLVYPVYARLLALRLEQWVESVRELADRLERDRPALEDRFGDGEALGPVVELEPLADDTHGDGRAVVAVTFESGVRIVYKPRPIEAMVVFYGVLDRLDPHLDAPSFEAPTWLQREEYGYVEWVEYRGVTEEAAAERYYRRAGVLVCLAYAFEFEDCHFENLITSGEQPLLVDAETFLAPYTDPSTREIHDRIAPVTDETVHTSMLLPFGIDFVGHEDELGRAGMSGIGVDSDPVELTSVTRPRIRAPNTDVMTVEQETPSFKRATNTLQLDGETCPPADYVAEILAGFTETYRTLRSLRESGRLLGDVIEESLLTGVENRFVYRATQQYTSLIRTLSGRDCLRDGVTFSIEIDTTLAAPFTDGIIDDDRLWSLYNAERAALRRLDPPRLTSTTDGTAVLFDGEPTGVDTDRSGFERAVQRLDALSEADERRQRRLLRESIERNPAAGSSVDGDETYVATPNGGVKTDGSDPPGRGERSPPAESAAVDRDDLEGAALDLLDTVVAARSEQFGEPNGWAFLDSEGLGASQVRLVDGSLPVGRPGIAVTAGACAAVTADQRATRIATTLGETIANRDAWPDEASHGLTNGVGARAYALGVLGDLVDERFQGPAVECLFDAPAVEDAQSTLRDGIAGTAIAALARHDGSGEGRLLELARTCGDELRARVEAGNLPADCGFERGRLGVAYALARLGDVDAPAYTDAATAVVETLPPSVATAVDQPVAAEFGMLGLSRLLDDVDTPAIRSGSGREYDHLWGGRAGVVEHALVTTGTLPPELGELTAPGAELTLPGHTETFCNPTLFGGLSGVAYVLCRAADPDAVPAVTLFE